MNVLKRSSCESVAQNPRALKNGRGKIRFCLLSWRIHFRTRKQKYRSKNWKRCKIAWKILKTKDEDRKIEDIPAAELNEFISEFIISVRTKDGNEYDPTSLRSLMASFQRHLKKKGYSASTINLLFKVVIFPFISTQ